MQDGIVVKGLGPKLLDPSRCHLNPPTDLNELEKDRRDVQSNTTSESSNGSIMKVERIKAIPTQSSQMPQPSTALLQA